VIDKEDLLLRAQQGIGLVERPYAEIAQELGGTEDDVLSGLRALIEDKMIRSLAPIYDTRKMSYDSALVAFEVAPQRIESAAAVVSTHPGVSHNYERPHAFNLWFTLAVPTTSSLGLDRTVKLLAQQAETEKFAILRAKKTFKIGVKLDPKRSSFQRESSRVVEMADRPLSVSEQEVIRVTQGALALVSRPFGVYAEVLGITEETLLACLRGLQARGVLRRIAAVAFHRKLGFEANGMAVWQVSEEKALEVGPQMASFSAISHCYLREAIAGWKHNLFAMIHGKEKQEVQDIVWKIQEEVKLPEAMILFSSREFKKQRILYFSQEAEEWERRWGISAPLAMHEA